MNLLQIILKQMRQRSLSTWLTLLSVLLGTGLAIGILIIQRESEQLFAQTDFGYDVLIGPPKGSPLQLTLNTIYHLESSPGVLPFSLYTELAHKGPPLPNKPNFAPLVRWAVPFMVGDSFKGRRIVGTSPQMFGVEDDGTPVNGEHFQYRLGKSYEFADGHAFAARKFEAVVGAETARALNLHVYDASKSEADNLASGGAFQATHGMPGPNETPDIHKPRWHIVGILKPTGTANDRVVFVPYVSLYAIAEHEDGMLSQALMRNRIDPSKVPPEKLDETLRQIGVDPARVPDAVRRRFKMDAATTAPANPSGDLMSDATPAKADEDPDAYHLDDQGNIIPDLPQDEWQISAILVKSRGGFQNQQLAYTFKVIDDRATAVNPASIMREFFNTFLASSTKILLFIAVLVIVVAGASIMTTIYNSVAARLREIAILRALGATRVRILSMISLEAALIGLVGGGLGLIVAHLLCAIGSAYMKQTVGESINWTRVSPIELYCFAGVVVLSFLAGLVPAMKAYQTSVADNLTAG